MNYNETVGKRIKESRMNAGLTLEELGNKVGLTKSTVTKYERGEIKSLDVSKIKEFARVLNIKSSYLAGWSDKTTTNPKGVRIPVLGRVAAGTPLDAIETYDSEEWEEIHPDLAVTGTFFALKIHGKSMEPKFSENDVVIVKQQTTVESGDIAVVLVNGCDATVKRVTIQENGILLTATNPEVYPPRFYSSKEIESLPVNILGKVIELRAKF